MTPPAIGQYWPGQGGHYAGIIRDTATNQQWHLILATQKLEGTWGEYGEKIEGEFSYTDGAANTALMTAAEPDNKAIAQIKAIDTDGHQDFYLPAQKELNLIYINLQDQCDKRWHWSSTQYSSNCALNQHFEYGYQYIRGKDSKLAVRAVRRLPI